MSGEERSARVASNARAALMRNVAGVLISLGMVPLALRALGTEGYGTFQILVSLGNLAAMSDIGLGLALLTRVGQMAGAQQHEQIRHVVGGALMVISMVVVVTASAALVALRFVDVPAFLKVPPHCTSRPGTGSTSCSRLSCCACRCRSSRARTLGSRSAIGWYGGTSAAAWLPRWRWSRRRRRPGAWISRSPCSWRSASPAPPARHGSGVRSHPRPSCFQRTGPVGRLEPDAVGARVLRLAAGSDDHR